MACLQAWIPAWLTTVPQKGTEDDLPYGSLTYQATFYGHMLVFSFLFFCYIYTSLSNTLIIFTLSLSS